MLHHVHPDPELASLIERCSASLASSLAPMSERLRTAAAGQPPTDPPIQMPCDARRLADAAQRLCDEEAFDQALPPALLLALRHPENPAFAFLAGSCLQRTAQPAAALTMFGLAGWRGGAAYAAVAAFRSGECLAALGKTADAIQVFDAAVEACRQDPGLVELQGLAQGKAEALRAG